MSVLRSIAPSQVGQGRGRLVGDGDISARLQSALNQDPHAVREKLARLWDTASVGDTLPIVLHGTRQVGLDTLSTLRRFGREPIAFTDNNPSLWHKEVEGIEVLPPQDAANGLGKTAVFVAALFHPSVVMDQLHGLGCDHVAPWTWLYHGHPEMFLPYWGLAGPEQLLGQADRLLSLLPHWGDEASRALFAEQVLWRLSLSSSCLSEPSPVEELYFAPDVVRLGDEEVFVDCGAYDGDSFRSFLSASEGRFRHAHLVEADPTTACRLADNVSRLETSLRQRTTVHSVALGSEPGSVSFEITGTMASRASQEGSSLVACTPLDDLLAEEPWPTFVKTDVEAAELELLAGARRTLERASATWAMMTYHRMSHLWEIPETFVATGDYDIYLRRYSEDCWETCLYALPRT